MSKHAFAVDYFDRLLARAVSTPAGGGAGRFDDPFERCAPWDLDAPGEQGTSTSKAPAGPLAAPGAPNTTSPDPVAAVPQPIPASTAHPYAAGKPASPAIAPPPQQPAYLNQDDLLSTADAFFDSLLPGAMHESAPAIPDPRMRAQASDGHTVTAPMIAPRPSSTAPGIAVQALVHLQPPAPPHASAAPDKRPPSAAAAGEKAQPQPAGEPAAPAPRQGTPVPAPPTVITVLPGLSTVTQHAHQLGSSARFGISQL